MTARSLLAAALLLTGCAGGPAVLEPAELVVARAVEVGGSARLLGDTRAPGRTPGALLSEVDALLTNRGLEAAEEAAARHPDAMLELLRAADAGAALVPAYLLVARAYDRRLGAGDPARGYEALLAERARDPGRDAAFLAARGEQLALLAAGRAGEAADLELEPPSELPCDRLLAIEAARLRGEALLLAGRSAEAAHELARAAALAGEGQLDLAARSALLAAVAEQRAGRVEVAAEHWRAAAAAAAALLRREPGAPDPILWERLVERRPAGASWPPELARTLAARVRSLVPPPGAALDPGGGPAVAANPLATEPLLWACLAEWRVARGERPAALTALRLAEAGPLPTAARERLRLEQAKLLVREGETAAASALLAGLCSSLVPDLAEPALALLGTIHLERGQVQRGLALLRQAVEDGAAAEWEGRGQAEADLGLAYLMSGDAERGLLWLHAAQERFANRAEVAQLRRALENERRWHEHQADEAQLARVLARLRSLEAR